MINKEQKLLESIYCSKEINETIYIGEEDVELFYENTLSKGKCKIQFDFIPRPKLVFDIKFDEGFFGFAHIFSSAAEASLRIISRDLSLNIICTKKSLSSNAPFRIIGIPSTEPITLGTPDNINKVVFHVVNFIDFWADNIVYQIEDKHIRGNRLILKDGKFDIIIESLPQTSGLIDKLKNQGGYAITHVGSIQRTDRKSFKGNKANEVLEYLFYFLSFIRGCWAPPIFPIGFDHNKNKVWEKWGCAHISSWRPVLTWFDNHHGNILPGLFTYFAKKMRDSLWSESIKIAIYWYILANTQGAGSDGAIILIQAALERLSWAYHVDVTKSMSQDGFSKLPAADQLRLLLLHADISIKVPNELSDLHAFAKKENYDGPGAFTYIRNRLVHPLAKSKKKEYSSEVLYQSCELGLWYIELILLSFFKYSGGYGNRLRPWRSLGQIEPVPMES